MADPATWTSPDGRAALGAGLARARDTLRPVAARARAVFGGPVTYAAGTWEQVDWAPFDIVSVDDREQTITADLVRDEAEPERYLQELLDLFDHEAVEAAFWFSFAGYELPHHQLRVGASGQALTVGTVGIERSAPPMRVLEDKSKRRVGR
jgi:hypothetical protein